MSACHGHYPACTHRDDSIACDACIERRKDGPLFCADLDNCAGPGCMDAATDVGQMFDGPEWFGGAS